MAKLDQQINAAFFSAFSRNATRGELDYYNRVGLEKLKSNLQNDPNAAGVYDSSEKQKIRFQKTIDALPPEYRTIFDQVQNILDETVKRGQAVNPDIEITPEKAAEFLQKAEGEINPYYSTQLKLAKEGFLESVGYDKQGILDFEKQLGGKFKQGFQQIGESAAEQGFALSGRRSQTEQNLVADTQQTIDEERRALQARTAELSRAFGQQYAGLPGYEQTQPTIGAAPSVTDQGFTTGTGEQPIYSLSPEIYDKLIGEQEFTRRAGVQTRSSELESAFREQEALRQQRTLTI